MEKYEIEQVLKNQIRVINHYGDNVEIAGEVKLREILDSVDILQFVFNVNKEYGLSFGNNIGDEQHLTTLDKVVSWVYSAINKKAEDERK
ncbi:hypothetical protein IM817_16965 [Serratia marcescens]|uniref:hypothetical protein n=1 Tax=Serratia marcescens TaxID=615 RepID=UPI001C57D21D|nr:hypothetical protein [Serratia marcescens]QXX95025.1 hypothetical protein IM817_16965 [Serratia marcescens]